MIRIILSLHLILILISCNSAKDINLNTALKLAGDNRAELEKVLTHYLSDSSKLEAAKFLISNMPYHLSLEEYYLSPDGGKYRPDVSKFENGKDVKKYCDSLVRVGYRPVRNKIRDIEVISADFLIDNIDLAFAVWQKPWAKDISFHDFCRYILPYRAQVEDISPLRAYIMNEFMPLLDSAKVTSPIEACMVLNNHLKSVIKYEDTGLSFYPTIEETYASGISRCEGLCNFGTFAMRAVGIPVVVDQTTWVKMDLGHSWCAVLDEDKFYSFGPGEDQPYEHAKLFSEIRHRRPAKVYRTRFDFVAIESDYYYDDKYITNLKSPLIYDVTNEYLDTPVNITITVDKTDYISNSKSKQIYLCVRNFYEWKPIAIGRLTELVCSFNQVVGDNIFIVADSPDGNTLRFITAPFYVSTSGETRKFIPDSNISETLILKKRDSRIDDMHTLKYWDTNNNDFVTINHSETSDSTQTYTQVPRNSLLWFGVSDRIINQRIFFINNGEILRY